MGWYSHDWRPYVSVAERKAKAAKKIAKMKKAGQKVSPVEIEGRTIASTFWGRAWCKNLEAYSDYANRLPRGRTYVRNGSVIDLQVWAGSVRALVSGSSFYDVSIQIQPLPKKQWVAIKRQCGGQIGSLVELLQGSISKGVMEIVTRKGDGLFPTPKEIELSCSCPDWAIMCKHVAAVLYGVGARLDREPELLFVLRGVDPTEMVEAAIDQPLANSRPRHGRVLEADELSSVFGIDFAMEGVGAEPGAVEGNRTRSRSRATRRATPAAENKGTRRAAKKPAPRAPRRKSLLPYAVSRHTASSQAAQSRGTKPRPPARPKGARPAKPAKLSAEALDRMHGRAFDLVERSAVLRQIMYDLRLVRGRIYLWQAPDSVLARITPLGPRIVALEAKRGRTWDETARGSLKTVLKAVEAEAEVVEP